jgi:hypothetical protein
MSYCTFMTHIYFLQPKNCSFHHGVAYIGCGVCWLNFLEIIMKDRDRGKRRNYVQKGFVLRENNCSARDWVG